MGHKMGRPIEHTMNPRTEHTMNPTISFTMNPTMDQTIHKENLMQTDSHRYLVIGGTGKTGRRVVNALAHGGLDVLSVSRSTDPAFDWNDESTWSPALQGRDRVYVTYSPDLAVPGAVETVEAFVQSAIGHGVRRLVLLSGRGEEEAQRAEQVIQRPELEWTVVRASWFAQNFSEGPFREMVLSGAVRLPAGDVREPFVDAGDIAEVAVAALTEEGHQGEIYEVTGPRLLTFEEAVAEVSRALGRKVRYNRIPAKAFTAGLEEAGLPDGVAWLMDYLFTTVLDGRNEYVTDGVERALGRPARDFRDYARTVAEAGEWEVSP
jgi:uncharacterized protein YbjT (DUF2867 family)